MESAAVEMLTISKDAVDEPFVATNLALVFAWTGELNLAFGMLADLAKTRTVFIAATE